MTRFRCARGATILAGRRWCRDCRFASGVTMRARHRGGTAANGRPHAARTGRGTASVAQSDRDRVRLHGARGDGRRHEAGVAARGRTRPPRPPTVSPSPPARWTRPCAVSRTSPPAIPGQQVAPDAAHGRADRERTDAALELVDQELLAAQCQLARAQLEREPLVEQVRIRLRELRFLPVVLRLRNR